MDNEEKNSHEEQNKSDAWTYFKIRGGHYLMVGIALLLIGLIFNWGSNG